MDGDGDVDDGKDINYHHANKHISRGVTRVGHNAGDFHRKRIKRARHLQTERITMMQQQMAIDMKMTQQTVNFIFKNKEKISHIECRETEAVAECEQRLACTSCSYFKAE